MRVLSMAAGVLVLVGSSLGVAGCKAAPQPFSTPDEATTVSAAPVRATFDPPADKEITERSVQSRVERAAGAAPVTEVVDATLVSRFVREPNGWTLIQKVPSVKITQNGTEVQSDLAQLVTKFPIAVQIATDGSFVQLVHYEEIEQALREAIGDPQQQEMILATFSPDAIEQQSKAEWSEKYGDLLGRDLVPGMALYGVEAIGTSRGDVAYVLERKVTGTRMGEHGRELVFELSCPTEAAKAADPQAAQRALELKGNPQLDPSVKCHGEQVVGLEPFVPRGTTLEVSAVSKVDGAEPLEIVFTRKVQTQLP